MSNIILWDSQLIPHSNHCSQFRRKKNVVYVYFLLLLAFSPETDLILASLRPVTAAVSAAFSPLLPSVGTGGSLLPAPASRRRFIVGCKPWRGRRRFFGLVGLARRRVLLNWRPAGLRAGKPMVWWLFYDGLMMVAVIVLKINRCEEWFRNIDEVGSSAQHLPCIINQPYGYMYTY